MSDPTNYTVGWICAIMPELVAAQVFLDESHEKLVYNDRNDNNAYTLGKMGKHNVAIATLPNGQYGLVSAATVAKDMQRTFPNLRICLMVGIGGGAPTKKHDIRLGDVVISEPGNGSGGVFQYDYGKAIQGQGFLQTGFLNMPPKLLGNAVADLRAAHEINGHQINEDIARILDSKPRLKKSYRRPDPESDKLYRSDAVHPSDNDEDCATACSNIENQIIIRPERTEEDDNPAIHYGVIASANQLMKDAAIRDQLANARNILCFEMEAAGLMNDFPCLVIRGICDYADSHKNKLWQGYAAMVAAAYAKDLLLRITPTQIEAEKKIQELALNIQHVVSTTAADMEIVKADVVKKGDIEVLNWLTTVNYGLKQSDTFNSRQPGTGKWFLNSHEYQNWIKSEDENTLFCPGMPGAGKTTIISVIVDDLKIRFDSNPGIGVAYIYCIYKGEAEQRLDLLLASLVKQLASLLPTVPDAVQLLFKKHERQHTRPSIEELTSVLHSVAMQFSTSFIILDALDELRETSTSWTDLLMELFKLQKVHRIKIIATSRPISEIVHKFDGCKSLEIRAQASDVQCYLEHQLIHLPAFVAERAELQEEIKTKIINAVDGMFLLAKLYFDSLRGKKSARALRKTLSSIGTTTDSYSEAYDQAMKRINSQLQDETKLAKEVLLWIIFAKRSLTITEILHALAVELEDSEPDEENMPHINHIISVCAGLVTFDAEGNNIRLVHYTTQQYFEQTRSRWFPDAEDYISDICLTYLSFTVFDTVRIKTQDDLRGQRESYPLYEYAAINWGHHARLSTHVSKLAIEFLNSETKVEVSSQILMKELYRSYEPVIKPLLRMHLVAYFGIDSIANQILPAPDLDAKDCEGRSPLSWAAEKGQEAIVRRLLEKGADINSWDSNNRTPLGWAVEKDQDAIVELLVERNADTGLRGKHDRTPLGWAAEKGYEAIIKLLLEKGADINLPGKYDQTPLGWATEKGHEAIVRLLLKEGADINLWEKRRLTPFEIAVRSNNEALVRIFLENGADIAKQDRSPLPEAVRNSNELIINLLLEAGADIDLRSSRVRTPLMEAVDTRNEKIVRFLLEKRANPNAKEGVRGMTPLGWAARAGSEAIVRLLLEHGADPKIKDSSWEVIPLTWAARMGYEHIVRLLLEANPDPESKGKEGQALMEWACRNDFRKEVSAFHQVDIDAE